MTNKKKNVITHDENEYLTLFPEEVREKALIAAMDVRKFEVDLYWKRAAYFWTIIAAAFIGFGASQQLSDKSVRTDLSVVVSCLGTLLSFAWFCINKGSKYWQMNWEKHVEMLEDGETGPLYKINWLAGVNKGNPSGPLRSVKVAVIEGGRFSVTRINQLVSLFMFLFWVMLLVHSLPMDRGRGFNLLYVGLLTLTAVFCILVVTIGRSGRDRPLTIFKIRGEKD